ncbi:RNA polymerase II [Lysinibacillus sp. 2017]|uniref:RNA polymerase II n=1 Tax=unclassified Lysinibacillus TaxID=2636778 RepID=UPI000D529A8D|nr:MULTISPECIES: RNA polymerase II [unclassified Lysinibacillus]AWE06560.1 RNA polymerase II [Lysinibacillus sp. 2017]TGN35403.1 RNA polymerase II [Lysinibacillus sp. S2017]
MKIAVSIFSFLAIIIGTIVFVQFQVYSDEVDSIEKGYKYSQEIEIVYRGESLDIRQHFKNLPSDEVTIQWPISAVNPNCFIENEHSCSRLSEDSSKFKEGDTRGQSISYTIPLEKGLQSQKLMKNVFTTLKNGDVQFSTVHITTDHDIEGQWVTGLPLIGEQNLALVNYTMFSGKGPVTDLFWQSGGFDLQNQSDVLSIYSKTPLTAAFYEKLAKVNFLSDDHLAIINGTNKDKLESDRMLFLPDVTVAKVQQNVIISQLESMYQFGDTPNWIKELMASYLTGSVFGSDKTKEVAATITAQMTEEQLADWNAHLKDLENKKISAQVLDEQLSAVLGASTKYVTMSARSKTSYPFLYNDPREIYVDLHKQSDIQVVLKDGEVLYSADSLLNALGYDVKTGENGYYVTSETRSFRFPMDPGFYVFNQRRYNTVSMPIKMVADQHFIEESWLQRLFLIELKKSDNRITINTPQE